MLSATELAAVLTAIATLIAALGWGAVRSGRKENPPPRLLTEEEGERLAHEVIGHVRQMHQEVRLEHRDLHDATVRIEAMLKAGSR